ncbi:D-glycero-alpha-D-manno-heptose-1,7-bisphosphate 7-phosphatase [Streptomyces albidoflavus]
MTLPPLAPVRFTNSSFGPVRPGSPALLLDRDGVLIENAATHVRQTHEVSLIPGAAEAVARVRALGYIPVVLSNQAMVARNLATHEQMLRVHEHVLALLAERGCHVAASYLCPHRGRDGCPCRKPGPGMARQAAAELGLDLSRSVLVGDALTDVEAARGCGARPHLVLTGRGRRQLAAADPRSLEDVVVLPDLRAVADRLEASVGAGG